jgi:hypothetical protein
VLADVEKSAKLIFAIAKNQNTFVADVYDEPIADLAKFCTQTSKAPIRAVNFLHLETKNFGRVVFCSRKTLAQTWDFLIAHESHPKPVGISS